MLSLCLGLFWLSAIATVYTYVLYPILLMIITRDTPTASQASITDTPKETGEKLPSVGVIVSAYNEEKDIEQRVENLLALDYPEDQLTIYIGSDGSSDSTNDILESYRNHPRVSLRLFSENRGKASVLNDLVEQSDDQILVFTDANTHFEADNINQLVACFDESIGGVCGELVLYDPTVGTGDNKDSTYWRYEQFLKIREGRLGSIAGANGANYAIRRELYTPLPPETIVDDFVIACDVVLSGWDFVYTSDATAKEEQAPDVASEFQRRVRIGAGNYQALGLLWSRVLTARPMFQFIFFSHKILRWLVPHFMLVCLASSAILATSSAFFSAILIIQLAIYSLCGLVYLSKARENWPTPILLAYFVCSMNFALGKGFIRYVRGTAKPTWQRTTR